MIGFSCKAGHTWNTSIGSRCQVRTYPSSSINLYTCDMKLQAVWYPGIQAGGMHFRKVSMHHMLDMFCVWYVVIYLSMVELKGTIHNSNQGNRRIRSWKWSRVGWMDAMISHVFPLFLFLLSIPCHSMPFCSTPLHSWHLPLLFALIAIAHHTLWFCCA